MNEILVRALPQNGPELACAPMADWAGECTGLHFIPPGQPWRNGLNDVHGVEGVTPDKPGT